MDWRIFLDQVRGIVIKRRIEHVMWIGVAREKTLQAHDIGRVFGADQDWAAAAGFNQGDAAQDQRVHDKVAEFGLLDHHSSQMVRRDQKGFHVLDGINVDKSGPA